MIKILFVEDDPNLAYMIKSGMEDILEGYEVTIATNGAEGLEAWNKEKPDIIVTDIDMPVMDGKEMIRRIREIDGDTIILCASGQTSPRSVKEGFVAGANSYVKKPYMIDELDGYIQALVNLRSGNKTRCKSDLYKIGAYTFDPEHATLVYNGENSTLTVREAAILQILCENKGEVVKREMLLNRFWLNDDFYASRSLDVFISKLRKYLGKDLSVEIRTVKGIGLMLVTAN